MIELSEHKELILEQIEEDRSQQQKQSDKVLLSPDIFSLLKEKESKPFFFDTERFCFSMKQVNRGDDRVPAYKLKADYYVGLDWLVKDKIPIYVEPKMNAALTHYFEQVIEEKEEDNAEESPGTKIDDNRLKYENYQEIDYLKMLLDVLSLEKSAKEAHDLVYIDWNAPPISIKGAEYDRLTPFLIVQFLQSLRTIVRKGLKKSYYKIQKNLRNRIKGKILVGQHIKQNVFKNQLTTTYCEYQEFGIDSTENRFLKKVLRFCSSYVEIHKDLFMDNLSTVQQLIKYCRPAFRKVGEAIETYELKHVQINPFFKEYEEALEAGKYILNRFSYNLTRTTETKTEIPPFWIDMPRLFELYFYYKLLKANPVEQNKINFQFSTYGNALDFLISKENGEMVIDTKYKPYYNKSRIHDDIRQVSGYARLKKVRKKLKLQNTEQIIDCLIVYPKLDNQKEELSTYQLSNIKESLHENPIEMYYKVYKLGINLPVI